MNFIFYQIPLLVFAASLFIAILLIHLLGVKTGTYRRQKNPNVVATGIGPLETALLGLLSLLLSFTFSMSASRYDARRSAIVTEANNISTAVMNTDLYPDSIRKILRKDLEQYLNERMHYFQVNDEKEIAASLIKAQAIHLTIWKQISALSHDPINIGRLYHMVPALHDMGAAAISRDALRKARVPYSIIWLLIILSLLGSFIIGYAKKQRKNDWIILFIYASMTVVTLFTILDLDNSHNGLIKTDGTHTKIDELVNLFKE
jgi:NADH:ubiquinone oxidoreductase subunit 5 (subunit L)/multisubunit Na+/H+ antiporter MnhA subunit